MHVLLRIDDMSSNVCNIFMTIILLVIEYKEEQFGQETLQVLNGYIIPT